MPPPGSGVCPRRATGCFTHNHRMSERVIPLIDQRLQTRRVALPAHEIAATGLIRDALDRKSVV